jgi:rhomboid protease GluP
VVKNSNKQSEKYINDLKNRGIYYWNENLLLLKEIEKMPLPTSIREKHSLLERYCKLYLRLFEMKHLRATEQSDQYDEAIYDYELEIVELTNAIRRK